MLASMKLKRPKGRKSDGNSQDECTDSSSPIQPTRKPSIFGLFQKARNTDNDSSSSSPAQPTRKPSTLGLFLNAHNANEFSSMQNGGLKGSPEQQSTRKRAIIGPFQKSHKLSSDVQEYSEPKIQIIVPSAVVTFVNNLRSDQLSQFLIWFLYHEIVSAPGSPLDWYNSIDSREMHGWIALGRYITGNPNYGRELVVFNSVCDRLDLNKRSVCQCLARLSSSNKMECTVLAEIIAAAKAYGLAEVVMLENVEYLLRGMKRLAKRVKPRADTVYEEWKHEIIQRLADFLSVLILPRLNALHGGPPVITGKTTEEKLEMQYYYEAIQQKREVPQAWYNNSPDNTSSSSSLVSERALRIQRDSQGPNVIVPEPPMEPPLPIFAANALYSPFDYNEAITEEDWEMYHANNQVLWRNDAFDQDSNDTAKTQEQVSYPEPVRLDRLLEGSIDLPNLSSSLELSTLCDHAFNEEDITRQLLQKAELFGLPALIEPASYPKDSTDRLVRSAGRYNLAGPFSNIQEVLDAPSSPVNNVDTNEHVESSPIGTNTSNTIPPSKTSSGASKSSNGASAHNSLAEYHARQMNIDEVQRPITPYARRKSHVVAPLFVATKVVRRSTMPILGGAQEGAQEEFSGEGDGKETGGRPRARSLGNVLGDMFSRDRGEKDRGEKDRGEKDREEEVGEEGPDVALNF